ncbi:hypothetical protein G9373_09490 [Rhodococcus sp. A14]|nr:hypothetical protein [Rhodococcus sp. A14]
MTLNRNLGGGLLACWPTPVYTRIHDATNVNAELRSLIMRRSENESGIVTSNLGAWQSEPDLLTDPAPSIRRITSWIDEATSTLVKITTPLGADAGEFGERRAEAWAVRYRQFDSQSLHVHPGSAWSGVYYVHATPDSGVLELLDPRLGYRSRGNPCTYRVIPSSGLLVAFPSWLEHRVLPHRVSEVRICIAFNVGYRL